MSNEHNLLLAGDIGGTKTALALYDSSRWPGPPLASTTYRNREAQRFEDLIEAFLRQSASRPAFACFGAAGPVLDETMQLTNLDWEISAPLLRDRFGFSRVLLINDLVATAMGATLLPKGELLLINAGEAEPRGTVGVIAPGTGLGEAFLLWDDGSYAPSPSEGGHAAFAPRNALQVELLQHLQQDDDHVSFEQVCSGTGLPNLFAFLQTRYPTPGWLTEELDAAPSMVPVIVQAAVASKNGGRPCPLAEATIELFTDILAGEAANLALKILPLGGMYIGGGIPPRILPFLEPGRFMATFSQGLFHEMLEQIPVNVILNPRTALLGAAACGVAASSPQGAPHV